MVQLSIRIWKMPRLTLASRVVELGRGKLLVQRISFVSIQPIGVPLGSCRYLWATEARHLTPSDLDRNMFAVFDLGDQRDWHALGVVGL